MGKDVSPATLAEWREALVHVALNNFDTITIVTHAGRDILTLMQDANEHVTGSRNLNHATTYAEDAAGLLAWLAENYPDQLS